MNTINLTIGDTTKSLDGWGFKYARLRLRSRAASMLILDRGGDLPENGPTIAFGTHITMAVALGDGSTYFWQGKRRDFDGRAYPDAPSTSMQFEDAWGSLSRTIFQHFWQMSDGSGHTTNKYFSRINLFQDIHAGPEVAWQYLTADNQIRQIIDFSRAECGLPVQYGAVDPIWNMPVYACKAITCAEACQLVMKTMPDMTTYFDHSTTPSTLHFRQRTNCTPITLPYKGTDAHGRHHKQSSIKPRPDLQVPSVTIQYQITGTIDGASYNDSSVDAYPPFATGLAEQAMVFPVDLRGPSRSDVKGTLVTEAVDPTTTAFWKEHKPDLNDVNIVFDGVTPIVDTTINGGGGHPDGITILDSDGATVDLADYPNKLISGQPAQWMVVDGSPVEAFEVTIRATLKYVKNIPTSTPTTVHKMDKHVVEVRLRLTDAPTGSTDYSITGSSDSGDPIPLNLAYFIWCSVNNVPVNYAGGIAVPPVIAPSITAPDNFQWEGEHEIVEQNIYSIVTPGHVLNLAGGWPDWANMNAVIYGVDIDFFAGRTSISFGPFKHLQAAEYFEMVMAFRYRQVFDNPNLRNTGSAGSAGATDLGGDSPKENTTHGTPQQPLTTTHAPDVVDGTKTVFVQHDAKTNGGQMEIRTIDAAGDDDDSRPTIRLAAGDIGTVDDAGLIGREMVARLLNLCDSSGTIRTAYFAMTEPE